jgi:hypothetical protein
MQLHSINNFLKAGTGALPNGKWKAVAIHPSSEVDLLVVNGYTLSIGAIVPLTSGGSGAQLLAVRSSSTTTSLPAGGPTPLPPYGDKLVVQLYEECDALIPPGPRVPTLHHATMSDTILPVSPADPELALVVPMQGRSRCTLSFARSDSTVDLEVFILGIRLGAPGSGLALPTETSETWWNGGGAAPTDAFGNVEARTINVENECFDLIAISFRGAAGAGSSYVIVEVFGEHSNL